MGNVLEFYLKMKDMMSSGLAKVAKTGTAAFTQIENAAKKFQDRTKQKNDTLGSSFDMLKTKAAQLEQVISRSNSLSHIKAARQELAALQTQMAGHAGNLDKGNGQGMFGGLFKKVAPAVIAAGALAFGNTSVRAAMDFGATKESFKVLTGDRNKGNGLANELNELQQNTILGPEVFKAAQTMMSFGVATEKVVKYEKMLGDISMGNKDKFESLTLAFSQTQAAGKLMGQDLLQYINAGFNPLQTMSERWKEFGFTSKKSVGELKEMMEKGAISSGMVAKAFELATGAGGKFNNMMNTIAETSYGKMQILEGQWENMKIQVGEALMPIANGLMKVASGTLDWLNITKTQAQQLRIEQSEIQLLVQKITALNEGNATRKQLLSELVSKYPDLFGNINKEKIANSELLQTLDKINDSYRERISLAAQKFSIGETKGDMEKQIEIADNLMMVASLLKSGDIEAAKKARSWENALFGPKIGSRTDYANVAATFEKEAQKHYASAKGYQETLNTKNSKLYIQENAPILKEMQQLAGDKNMRASFFKGFSNKGAEGDFMKAFEEYKKLDTGTRNSNFDYKGFKSKYLTASAIKESKKDEGVVKSQSDNIARGTVSGGPRIININGVKFMDKLELHTATFKEGQEEMQAALENMFLRILNSGASVQ